MEQIESILKLPIIECKLAMPCIICGESVELTEEEEMSLSYGDHVRSKVCNECRSAILYMRERMPLKEN